MTSPRDRVLGDIRRSLGGGSANAEVARERIRQHPRHILPAFGESADTRFVDKLHGAAATVARVNDDTAATVEIARYLEAAGIDEPAVIGNAGLAERFDRAGALRFDHRPIANEDLVSITPAFCGIAETGTLMLLSGEQDPTRLNFMPDYHIAILPLERLVCYMEEAWDLLRATGNGMPRTVNFISGPSKTADVEQTVEYGAHGPRCLHVVLIG